MLLISVLVTIFMTILKAYAWLLKQLLKLIWSVYKLFLCLFPAAGVVLAALVIFECVGYFTGNNYLDLISDKMAVFVQASENVDESDFLSITKKYSDSFPISSDVSGYASSVTGNITNGLSQNIEEGVTDISTKVTQSLLESVTSWWEEMLKQNQQKAYMIIAWVITILIGIPVFLGILILSAAVSGMNFLAMAIICDLVIYVVRSVFTMSTPFKQIRKRYCFLFHTRPFYDPKYEDSYQEWLKRHHDEFENDTFGTARAVNSDYEPEEDYDRMGYTSFEGRRVSARDAGRLKRLRKRQKNYDDYYEDYYNDYYDRIEDAQDRESEPEDDYYEDSDTYEGGDNYEDSDYEGYSRNIGDNNKYSSFNFFAGCKTRDGVVKKYHSLAKLYHPDNFEGDLSAIAEINRQYKEAIKKYRN